MGLSNDKPRDQFNTLSALLEMAQGLKMLTNNPKALEELIKTCNALPPQEEAKANLARESIAKYEGLVAENNKLINGIEAARAALKNEKDSIDYNTKLINENKGKLDEQAAELNAKAAALADREKQLARDEANIIGEKAKLEQSKVALDKREAGINEYEASLKDKAAQLQALTKGL